MFIIGFGGPAEHGKSTCANIAEEYLKELGLTVKVISFADKLKEVCKIMFRLTDRDVNTTVGKATYRAHIGTTPREVMQKFGTEICRNGISTHLPSISSTIWTWNVEQDILDLKSQVDVIIIPDVRFPDELEMLRKFELVFINVQRPGLGEVSLQHSSEAGLPEADYEVENNTTLSDLKIKITALVAYIIN
jgi:hypothetical protein